MAAAAVEFFDVKTAAGVLHLAARRLPYSESRRFVVRYSSLGEKDRLKELAKNIFTAEGKRLASARTLSRAPLAVVKTLEAALFRLTIAGDDGREVDDFAVAAAEVGLNGDTATAAEVRRASEISQRREEIVRKWEIAAARIIAVVRGIVGLRSETSDLFFSPEEARRRKAQQSDITENVIAYAKASGAKIIDNRGKANK